MISNCAYFFCHLLLLLLATSCIVLLIFSYTHTYSQKIQQKKDLNEENSKVAFHLDERKEKFLCQKTKIINHGLCDSAKIASLCPVRNFFLCYSPPTHKIQSYSFFVAVVGLF